MSQLTPKQFEDQLNQRLPSESSRALVRCLLRLPTQWAQVNDRHTAQWLGQFFTLHPLPHDLEQLTFDQLVLQTLDAPTREQAGWFAHTLHQHQVTHFEERMLDVDWIPTLTTQRAFHGRRIVTSGGVVGFLYGGTLVGLAGLPFGFVLGTTIGLVGGLLFIALDRVVNRNQPLRMPSVTRAQLGLVALVLFGATVLLNPTWLGVGLGFVLVAAGVGAWQLEQATLPYRVAQQLAREGLATRPIRRLLRKGVLQGWLERVEGQGYRFQSFLFQNILAQDFAHTHQLEPVTVLAPTAPSVYIEDVGVICLDAQQRSHVVRASYLPADVQALQPYLQVVAFTAHTVTIRFELTIDDAAPWHNEQSVSLKVGSNTVVGGARLTLDPQATPREGQLSMLLNGTPFAEYRFKWVDLGREVG